MSVAILGGGIHRFGRTPGVSGLTQGAIAARRALDDAGLSWADVQFAAGGSGDAGNADSLVSDLGLTGLPFINVYNGCATGGSALIVSSAMVESGSADVAIAIGFDAHPPGAFSPLPSEYGIGDWYGESGLMLTTQFFAMKIQRYMHDFGIDESSLAQVAAKAFRNGSMNENAWRRTPFDEATILNSTMISPPLTKYMFCSPAEGAVALVLCRSDKARQHTTRPIRLLSSTFRTRSSGAFEVFNPYLTPEISPAPTVAAASACFEQAGLEPSEIDVAQIQDTEAGAEIMHMAETGLCRDGEQPRLIADGDTEITGRIPINTDGGCIANGEPVGASGLRQVYENVLQLRGIAGARQVHPAPRTAFTHVYGGPGVSACTVLAV